MGLGGELYNFIVSYKCEIQQRVYGKLCVMPLCFTFTGSALQYPNPTNVSESQHLQESHQLSRLEVSGPQASEFGDTYSSSQRAADNSGLHFTVKAEKEEDQSGFSNDGCQHGAGKQAELAADFSMDERENHMWSSIIEGSDIEAGFPDFSSVVDEYSSMFADHSDTCNTTKLAGVRQLSSQRPNNGLCNSEFQKDTQQPSSFHPQGSQSQQNRQREQMYEQRNPSHMRHLDEEKDWEGATEDRPRLLPSHTTFTPGGFPAHKSLSGMARSYVCSQCGKTFGRLHQFKLHHQSHKRKRTFWCTVCGKNFQCSSHLSIHHRTHTGEKPYGCGQCGKRFTQQSSLRVHQRTHSGERPYSCTLCGKTFILMHHLKRHRIIHTHS